MAHDYYMKKQDKLIKEHQQMVTAGRGIVVERYGAEFADTLFREALAEFKTLIPELPYIGGDQNALTDNLVQSASPLALYRVAQRYDIPIEETGELVYQIAEAWVQARVPRFLGRLFGLWFMSGMHRRRTERAAIASQAQRYPGDWVRTYVPGDGDAYAWGTDYTECGIVKFYQSQGASDFAPYLCLLDYVTFGAMGVQMIRTQTLAQGCEKCDFRFKRGGEMASGWPPPWLNA